MYRYRHEQHMYHSLPCTLLGLPEEGKNRKTIGRDEQDEVGIISIFSRSGVE
jgi:hypothetical protein